MDPQGGGTGKGKTTRARRGLRPAGPGGRRSPGRSCPLLAAAQRAPRPRLIPGCRARRHGSRTFRWGARSWGRGGGGEGGPGLPALWALAAGRPGRSSGRGGGGERGPGDAAGGPRAAAAAAGCQPGRGADRPRGRRGAGRRRRRRDPGATCWRSAAAAIPGDPGRRHPPAWPRGGAGGRGAALSARPAGPPVPPGPRALRGAGVRPPAPRGSASRGAAARGARLRAPSSPASPRRSPGPISFSTALRVGDPPGQPTPRLEIPGARGPDSLVSGKF